MNRNFKIDNIDEHTIKVTWKLNNTIVRDFVWSEIKDMPLLNDLNEPIGVLDDFILDTTNNKFEVVLVFYVWKIYEISSFKDIEVLMLDNGKLMFKMI